MESYPSGKGQVCKTSMQRFDSARLLKRLVFAGRFFSECFEKFLLFKIAFRLNILSHLLVALFCMRFAWFSHFTKLAFCKTFFLFRQIRIFAHTSLPIKRIRVYSAISAFQKFKIFSAILLSFREVFLS